MSGYIDMHAHILPGADHGSSGVDMSLRQLALAEAAGVSVIAATPHFHPDKHHPERFISRRDQAYAALAAAYSGPITILPGAEVHLCEGLHHLAELDCLCIGSTRLLLAELPPLPWSRRLVDTLLALEAERGFTLLLAHIERYPPPHIEALLGLGISGQINGEALLRPGRARLRKLIDRGQIAALGSDIHGLTVAYAQYAQAWRRLGDRAESLHNAMTELLHR